MPCAIDLKALAQERRRIGYRRLHVMLRREGHAGSTKRVQRIYPEEKLTMRRRGGRKRAMATRPPLEIPPVATHRWSLDFVSDQMTDGRRFRILTVIDNCARECLGLVADTSRSGRRVAHELDAIILRRGRPDTIISDNGTDTRPTPSWPAPTTPAWAGTTSRRADLSRTASRELQWSAAGRTAEDAVPIAAARPCRARSLTARLQ